MPYPTKKIIKWTDSELELLQDDELFISALNSQIVRDRHFAGRSKQSLRAAHWRRRTGYSRAKVKEPELGNNGEPIVNYPEDPPYPEPDEV